MFVPDVALYFQRNGFTHSHLISDAQAPVKTTRETTLTLHSRLEITQTPSPSLQGTRELTQSKYSSGGFLFREPFCCPRQLLAKEQLA